MKTLNELFVSSCKPKCESYKKITEDITLIDNFFENFSSARDFFVNRDRWKCIPYQVHSKPGDESIFPNWVGKSLMEKYITDTKIDINQNSYTIDCNFFYEYSDFIWSLSNSHVFPHYDEVMKNGMADLEYICLINLNLIPVSTNFYTFKDKKYCNIGNERLFNEYSNNIERELLKYYSDKKNITRKETKIFLDSKKDLEHKLLEKIEYMPNQAIIYPSCIFHSADITPEFSEDNPRVMLRISFKVKTKILSYF